MPSKMKKKELYIASSMAELQKKSEVKSTTTNARILVKSADTMFREAENLDSQGDEERAFIMYMRYFNIIKQVKASPDYKKNKQYYDSFMGQKNQVRAIEQAEQLAGSLKERYDFKEAEAVARKFAALEETAKNKTKKEKDHNRETDVTADNKTNGTSVDDADSKQEPSTSGDSQAPATQPLITPTAFCELLRDASTQLIIMDARSSADFASSHINHAACISVPQEILPPGTTVTRIESQLPPESHSLWKQRGNVDHIVMLDWRSKLETLDIGTTLRTLKDALFKYDSTVIIKSEPLVLEGGYEQWLLFYPTMTTNARVSCPGVSKVTSNIVSLDFDYPDFEEPQTTKKPIPDLTNVVDQSAPQDNTSSTPTTTTTNVPGTIPQFNRALKPKTPAETITDSIAKTTGLNNDRNLNLSRSGQVVEGPSILSNNLYPSVVMAQKPEKNTNITVDRQRIPQDGSPLDTSRHAASSSPADGSNQEVEQQARLEELVEKRKKEEKALADIMRKRRHAERDLKETERLVEQERQAKDSRDKAVQDEEAERRRQMEVERLRQERKKKEEERKKKEQLDQQKKEQDQQLEKERLDNLAQEKELQDAQERAKAEEETKAARKAAELHAEKLRQERADKARQQEADKLAQQKRAEELRLETLRKEEEERKRKEEERMKKEEEERKAKLEREKAEAAAAAARKAKQAEEDKRSREEREKGMAENVVIRHAQEPKMIPSPSLPLGWEKRLDSSTHRYYYIDHNHGKTQWEPPTIPKQPQPKDTYTTKLKDELSQPSRGMSRSYSSPDIMKQLAEESKGVSSPVFDRTSKPNVRPLETTPSRSTVIRQVARRRDLNPVYGSVGAALTGLRNLGNTCYMNSTIQCLNNTTPLVTYFLNDNFLQDINRDSVQGMHGEVVDECAVVVKALWSGQYRCITPRDLKNTVGKYNPMFAGYQQQDSQEFLTFLLDGLHEGLNEVQVRPQIPDQENDRLPDHKAAKIAWENHKRLHRSIIVELFQGQLKSTLMCRTCRKQSVTFQAFMYISLPIPATSRCTLGDCFRAFLQPEMMTGSCKWKCPQCRVERDAEKKIDIWKLPHILLIGLNRFVSDGMWMQKKTTYVDFPITDLDLEDVTLGPTQRARYSLYGVSNHYGTMEGGHYTAFCRNPCNNKWHKFDDHEVYEMSRSDVKTSAAFVLYYTSIPLTAPQFKLQL